MRQTYTALLFDLDGTLTDPAEGITKSIAYALAKMGKAVPERAVLIQHIGPPLHLTFQRVYGCDEAQAFQAVAWYREYFGDTGIFENAVYPGIAALLARLQSDGHALCVATSKPTVYAERIVAHFGLAPYFTAIVGSHLDGTRTDKGEVIAAALAQLPAADRPDALMIGDREHDILGARQQGLASVAVTYGYGALDELIAAQPTYLVHSVAELADLLT